MAIYWDSPTDESIAQAKHAMLEERAAVERVIGRPISEEGRILPFPSKPVYIRCAECQFEARGISERTAIRGMERHVSAKHDPRRTA